MDRIETGDLSWRLALEQRGGADVALLESLERTGTRLRIMVSPPGGGMVVMEIEGMAWPLEDDRTHPVALRLPSGARWPAHLRLSDPDTMRVTVPAQGQRLLAALRAARWVRIEHQEHMLMLTLPPGGAVDALQTLTVHREPSGLPIGDVRMQG
ncbi:hypothetical protein [Elioraea tepidiphila]|jgi:hypothetical protein|uniref:hypothetical protein n=1 Tax=Elioraea tepidiphila TaxID=457934 RepID=UPI00036AB843|nr:hypothetical protein [Elioraea tepidiphila]